MALSKTQEEEMYKAAIKSKESIEWIRERLENGDKRLDGCDDRIDKTKEKLSCLEGEWKLLKGKLSLFVLLLSGCFTAVLHAIGWILSHIWK